MPDIDPRDLRHIKVEGTGSTELYRAPGRGPRLRTPERTRQSHARHLLGQFRAVEQEYTALSEERTESGFDPQAGLILQFESAPDFDLKFESLDLRAKGIQLLSVRHIRGITVALCYVPDGKIEHFIKRIEEYRTQETLRGAPKNRNLVESIEAVRIAAVEALWTDREPLPTDDESFWWEIWLRSDAESLLPDLSRAAQLAGFTLSEERLHFPERIVVAVNCTKRQISRSLRLINSVAELRRAKATAADFLNLSPRDQHALTEELLRRISVTPGATAAACILDTGITQGHSLLAPALRPQDCHSVKD